MAKPAAPAVHLMQLLQDAVGLHRQGRLDEAEKLYSRALKLDRDQFDALHLLGMLNYQRGRHGEAHRLIKAALKVSPRSADALANLGMVLHALKRDPEALQSLDQALAVAPEHVEALNNRGNLLLDLKRPAEALAAFDRVLVLAPHHLQARVNRGNALVELGHSEGALVDYDAALALQPGNPHALYNRGNALRGLGRETEAVAAYDQALAMMPAHVSAWYNRALALQALNRHTDALASFAKAAELQPYHADAQFSAALSLLTLGDYRRGFAAYEWRWKRSGMGAPRRFRQPLWRGESPLAGKTILLHAEQGLGDTIQFARYAPLLARMDGKVVLEVQPELKDVFSGLEGASAVLARGEPLPPFDLQCPLASVPLALKTELGSVPDEIPYLRPSDERLARWRPRLEALPSPRIALAWSGRATHVNDRNRSIPLQQLLPLLSSAGTSFISIQRELRAGDADLLARQPGITHLGNDLTDFSDTAAVLTLVDLLISVDTSVVHLAGALGRPTWLLLPFQPDWRWTLDRDRSPWYPQIQLFRQSAPGDWDGVIAKVREKLASSPPAIT
jgi:tetratricopeptide (TPR) repeat protein